MDTSSTFRLFPERASTIARHVDQLFYYEVAVAGFFTALIFVLIVGFSMRFRRRSETYVPPLIHGSLLLEITWTVVPVLFVIVMFFWGAQVFIRARRVPLN